MYLLDKYLQQATAMSPLHIQPLRIAGIAMVFLDSQTTPLSSQWEFISIQLNEVTGKDTASFKE